MVEQAWWPVDEGAEKMEMGDELTKGVTGVGITFMV